MNKNEYFIDDRCFNDDYSFSYKNIDEINSEIAQELLESGLYEGKTFEEILEQVKNN